jgi:hypothetical protein
MQGCFFSDPEPVLGTLASLFAAENSDIEVAILTYSSPEIVEVSYDNWNGGTTTYALYLHLQFHIYRRLQEKLEIVENTILDKAQPFVEKFLPNAQLVQVKIVPAVIENPQWREKASKWLSGNKISNQGRVRSDNIASLSEDGLLFRSQPEIYLYQALKAIGVPFAPLPVFVKGGTDYLRIEPDFVIVSQGITLVVEVDGNTIHHETPAEAHSRTTMLQHEGVQVERIFASECSTPEKAKQAVQKILLAIQKRKISQR